MPGREDRSAPIWALGDATTVRTFALAGCRGCVVDAEGAPAALARARAEGATLVIASEALAEALEGAAAGSAPLVAWVPAATGPRPAITPKERVARVVGRALGVPGGGRPAREGRHGR